MRSIPVMSQCPQNTKAMFSRKIRFAMNLIDDTKVMSRGGAKGCVPTFIAKNLA